MDSIAQKLEKLYQSKLAIKNSLINKGLNVDDNLEDYSAAIDSLNVGATIETNSENLTTENKKEGDIVVVYDSTSSENAATVFKVVDTAEDIYLVEGVEHQIPNLGAILALETSKSGRWAIHFNESYSDYNWDTYEIYILPDDVCYFYSDVISNSDTRQIVYIANPNNYAVTIKEYYMNSSRLTNNTIAANGIFSTGTLADGSYPIFYYNNCCLYKDIDKTSVKYEAHSIEKVSNLEYTQIS